MTAARISGALFSCALALGCGDDSQDAETEQTNPSSSATSSPADAGTSNPDAQTTTTSTATGGSAGNTTPAETSAETSGGSGHGSTGSSNGGVPMFVALGQGGRRLVSCDDGQSWIAEQVLETNDDDHGPYSSRDVEWGDGVFLLGMGWGNPARIARSEDGIDWVETFPPPDYRGKQGLVGIAYGADRFVAVVGWSAWTSDDRGQSWTYADSVPASSNIRVVTYSPYGGGRYFAVADGGLIHRSLDGVTWSDALPTTGPCDGGNISRAGGIVDLDGTFMVVTDIGNVCRTDDGGDTFTHHLVAGGTGQTVIRSNVVTTGNGLFAAGAQGGWRSADGTDWEPVSFSVDGGEIRTLARSEDTDTLIGIAWSGDDFYRSTDGGSTWTRAEAPTGNDTNRAGFGWATASDICPAP